MSFFLFVMAVLLASTLGALLGIMYMTWRLERFLRKELDR